MDYNHGVPLELISGNVARLLSEIPEGVALVAAAKGRTPSEVLEAVKAGVSIIGENYISEAKEAYQVVGTRAKWHFIGTLQKHSIRRNVVQMFDMIETVNSLEIASAIDKKCVLIGRRVPVLIEVNAGRESQKSGVLPECVEPLIREIGGLGNLKVMGLMTMGPYSPEPEDSRPFFAETRRLFDVIKELDIPEVEMKYLSMGMTDSYRVAIEEGANVVRIGTGIFGERD
ncbi:MAG: YggS family pyridoxal phosphate-dependent enzyme [Dehalococcoidia bacterium]